MLPVNALRISQLLPKKPPYVVKQAKGSSSIRLEKFNIRELPGSSSGYTGNPRHKLPPGLQHIWKDLDTLTSLESMMLLPWDGFTCTMLVNQADRVMVVLGGVPPKAADADWDANTAAVTQAIKACYKGSTFSAN
ncbi:hypothetical protein BDP27DRAFT_1427841 [Rhodocollybia butyracea]|uniref:Uncharacterized protein n=1 Tax=Rhodocollybia butyracea TaxID=206335 RepID=A0A9P5U2C7_9AGAR|nr:hypothetical protein BDP27DRAFT_1427841 [Rhodocollybia butyracea]